MDKKIIHKKPNDNEAEQIIKLIKNTQNITGYTVNEIKSFDEVYIAYIDSIFAGAVINIHNTASIAEISVLVVCEKYKGIGIGKELFLTSLKSLESQNKTIWCVSRNPVVINFFRLYDFKIISFWKLPLTVSLYNLTFIFNTNRIKEYFRKQMYAPNLAKFQYAIKYKN
jgi:N-acetylglutamate synthase-like GNAT family acetyltransferase